MKRFAFALAAAFVLLSLFLIIEARSKAPLMRLSIFRVRALAVGDSVETTAQTRSFEIQLGSSATELPLRDPRRGATVSPSPNGTLAILGGRRVADDTSALSVELLFPQ